MPTREPQAADPTPPTSHVADDATAPSEFERLASRQVSAPSLFTEFVQFLSHNKKWWLAPIVMALLLIGLLLVLSSSALQPFLYTLF